MGVSFEHSLMWQALAHDTSAPALQCKGCTTTSPMTREMLLNVDSQVRGQAAIGEQTNLD
eukprot:1959688-Amphidinium_carterae.1